MAGRRPPAAGLLLGKRCGYNLRESRLRRDWRDSCIQRGDADGYLQTAVAHGADIRQQGVVGKGRYAYVVEVEHIRRFGVVIIGGEQQAVAEHGKVNTCIEGMFHFPFQVGIRV